MLPSRHSYHIAAKHMVGMNTDHPNHLPQPTLWLGIKEQHVLKITVYIKEA